MKNHIKLSVITVFLSMILFTGMVQAQSVQPGVSIKQAHTQEIVLIDTVGNSESKIIAVPIGDNLDSIAVSFYAHGLINLDSLDVKLGFSSSLTYATNPNTINFLSATDTTYSKVLTTANDTAVASFVSKVTTIPNTALTGYNYIQFTFVAGSTGNSGLTPAEKLVVVIDKYYSK
jgi:hypothetical protein